MASIDLGLVRGESAFETWKKQPGNSGKNEAQFIESLKGERGAQGIQGAPGAKGDRGEQGAPGAKGDRGEQGAQKVIEENKEYLVKMVKLLKYQCELMKEVIY